MPDFEVCQSPTYFAFDLPTVRSLPITTATVTELPLAYGDELESLATPMPVEAVVFFGVSAGAALLAHNVSAHAPRVGLKAIASAAGVLAVVTLGAACLFSTATAQIEKAEFSTAIKLMRLIEVPSRGLKWIVNDWPDEPALVLAEAASTAGIRDAVGRGDLATAAALAEWPVARTSEGRRARSAVLLNTAARELSFSHLNDALVFAGHAMTADDTWGLPKDAASVARAHLLLASLEHEDFADARQRLEEIPVGWRPETQSALVALLARRRLVAVLDSAHPDLDAARAAVEDALARAHALTDVPTTLRCDSVLVFEQLAERALVADAPGTATAYLARAEGYVRHSPLSDVLWPVALHLRGLQQLAAGQGAQAVQSFEEALRRDPANRETIHGDLAAALILRGEREMAERRFDDAFVSTRRAHDLVGAEETLDAVHIVHLARAEWTLRKGDWPAAQADLLIARSRPRLTAHADLRIAELEGARASIDRLRALPGWMPVPAVRGRLAVDANGDGHLDEYVYADADGNEVGWSAIRDASQIAFHADKTGQQILLRDSSDEDGDFDEWHLQSSDGSTVIVLDIDADARPDLRLDYDQNKLVREKPLSGRVLMRVASAVIAGTATDGVFAGEIDPYFVLSKNGAPLVRSRTVSGDRRPSWNEGAVINYRFGDLVAAHVYDDDLFYDDFIGLTEWRELPVTGYVTTTNGHAALDVQVEPSAQPEGWGFVGPPTHSIFRQQERLPADATLRTLVDQASRIEARTELYNAISRVAVTELLVMALVPRASLLVQLAVGVGLDASVVEAIYAD